MEFGVSAILCSSTTAPQPKSPTSSRNGVPQSSVPGRSWRETIQRNPYCHYYVCTCTERNGRTITSACDSSNQRAIMASSKACLRWAGPLAIRGIYRAQPPALGHIHRIRFLSSDKKAPQDPAPVPTPSSAPKSEDEDTWRPYIRVSVTIVLCTSVIYAYVCISLPPQADFTPTYTHASCPLWSNEPLPSNEPKAPPSPKGTPSPSANPA